MKFGLLEPGVLLVLCASAVFIVALAVDNIVPAAPLGNALSGRSTRVVRLAALVRSFWMALERLEQAQRDDGRSRQDGAEHEEPV